MKRLWESAQHGWPVNFPLVQFPNLPLIVAFAALAVSAVTDGDVHDYAHATFYAGLAAWAWLELTDGVNWVRRVLGALGLGYVVVKVGEALGA